MVSIPLLASATSSRAITVLPAQITLEENAAQQFTASKSASWRTNCGSISTTGLLRAPLYPRVCTITAIAKDGSGQGSANVNIVSPISLTPVAPNVPQGSTQQFTATMPVTWSSTKCGTISASGLYFANGAVGQYCTIKATASSGTAYTGYGYVAIVAPSPSTSITPQNPTITEGSTEQFVAGGAARWTASCGAILNSGLYTAPQQSGSCNITALSAGGSQIASTTATITADLTITPAASAVFALGKQQFTASAPAKWASSCGGMDAITGLFKAPAIGSDCIITATAVSGGSTGQTSIHVAVIHYTTWKNGNSRAGAQTQEFVLTPANVRAASFGTAWKQTVDGIIWSQPLYMNALQVSGAAHNVVFVTTSNDSVYAFDADSGTQLWKKSFLSNGVTSVPGSAIGSSMSPVGIVGTPVIDADDNTLYVVAMTAEQGGSTYVHRIHEIQLTTGEETASHVISAGSFADARHMQRPALLLANGRVYAAFGGIGERPPYNGWVFAFQTKTLAPAGVLNDDPSRGFGGIWMSGAGPASDSDGNLYVTSGNGDVDGINNYGESVLKVSPDLTVLDYFTPYDHVNLTSRDLDLGSGGVLVVPDQAGQYAHELIVCGKPKPIYVLNRDDMGRMGSTSDHIVQRLNNQLGATGTFEFSGEPCFSTPAIWKQNVYFVAAHDVMKMFTLNSATGMLSSTPVSHDSFAYNWTGAQAVVSSNGDDNGIVWTYDYTTGTLRANDASDVSKVLFQSTALNTRAKWAVPTVINGHVYLGLQSKIFAFASH